jgi:hypothetical protein
MQTRRVRDAVLLSVLLLGLTFTLVALLFDLHPALPMTDNSLGLTASQLSSSDPSSRTVSLMMDTQSVFPTASTPTSSSSSTPTPTPALTPASTEMLSASSEMLSVTTPTPAIPQTIAATPTRSSFAAVAEEDVAQGTPATTSDARQLNPQVHMFYYAWYGNPTHNNGRYVHWNHEVLLNRGDKQPNPRLEPPEDIGADFYPAHGLYSSLDRHTLDRHMREIASTGAGTIAHSWYPADRDGTSFLFLLFLFSCSCFSSSCSLVLVSLLLVSLLLVTLLLVSLLLVSLLLVLFFVLFSSSSCSLLRVVVLFFLFLFVLFSSL